MRTAQYHDLRHSPVALWNLDGDLSDLSGNGLTLSLNGDTPTERYASLAPGVRGFYFDGLTALFHASDALLQITGDLTIEFLFCAQTPYAATEVLFVYGGFGETENLNHLYRFTAPTPSGHQFLQENGAGVNSSTSTDNTLVNGLPHHVVVRRESNVITVFSDGQILSGPSAALTAPTGGSNSELRIGADPAGAGLSDFFLGNATIASFLIIDSAIDDRTIQQDYLRTLGPVYGAIGA